MTCKGWSQPIHYEWDRALTIEYKTLWFRCDLILEDYKDFVPNWYNCAPIDKIDFHTHTHKYIWQTNSHTPECFQRMLLFIH